MSTITTSQRQTITGLLRRAGCYDMRFVSLMHRRLGVDDSWQGRPVGEWIDSMSRDDASRLIARLQQQT